MPSSFVTVFAVVLAAHTLGCGDHSSGSGQEGSDCYPNGTCDELTIVLRSDENEWKKLSLEVTTGLATVGRVVP